MTNNSPKRISLKTLLKYKCYLLNNYNDLRHIIESKQFTVIEYKKHSNREPVAELIKKLNLENKIQQNDAFLYINNNLKIVFINADASYEDKCALLRHELGHICDPDLKNSNSQNFSIKKEEFANEFSCYTKNPPIRFLIYVFLAKKWKLLIGVIVSIACVLGCLFIIKNLTIPPSKPVTVDAPAYVPSSDVYYVTSAGKKYHQKHCIIIKYKNNLTQIKLNDAVKDGYKPCMICNQPAE